MATGRIRMVFVADVLPPELIRIIEFLNEQMSPAEVLGVAVPQFVGEDLQVLVPQVIGRTATAKATKERTGTAWDEESFLAVAGQSSSDTAEFFRALFDHVRNRGVRLNWGKGATPGVAGWYELNGTPTAVWVGNAGGPGAKARIELWLPEIHNRLAPVEFEAFAGALQSVPSFATKVEEARKANFHSRYPSVQVSDLVAVPTQVQQLLQVLDRVVAKTQPSAQSSIQ